MKYKKPSKNIDKTFAVVSCIGATLKATPNITPELDIVKTQVNRMMRVYSRKVGSDHYWKISKQIEEIWIRLAAQYENKIEETSINVLAQAIGHLVHEKTYYELLACNQPDINSQDISQKDYIKICKATLNLGDEFNQLFKTKSPQYSAIKHKPKIKVKKSKIVTKSKAQKKHEAIKEQIKQTKQRKKEFLQKRIAEARKQNQN